jgi:tRNA nucleotidyltransferase (CCA-adding enzyme)
VAAALSSENFSRLVGAAAAFLEKPSMLFFFPPKASVSISSLKSRIKSRGTKIVAVRFARPDVIDDVLWPQLRRTAQRLRNIMQEYDFVVIGWDIFADGDCIILLEFEVWKLPKIRKVRGPTVFAKERVGEFRKKYEKLGKVWVEDRAMFAEVRRAFTEAAPKLEDSLSDKESELLAKGIASYVAGSIAAGFDVTEGEAVLRYAAKNPGFALSLKKYLDKGEAA